MAQNVWQQEPHRETPKRNTFDLSFRNNLSMKIGKIYPVMCREVIPGDTFHIKSSFGLSLMPMAFPIQTPLRAHLSFYYVRNRNLWKNWKKFLRNKGQVQPGDFPYIAGSPEHMSEIFKTGGIADYLGCPTCVNQTFEDFSITQDVNMNFYYEDNGQYIVTRVVPRYSQCILRTSFIAKQLKLKYYTYRFQSMPNDLFLLSSWRRISDTDLVLTSSSELELSYVGSTSPSETSPKYYLALLSAENLKSDDEVFETITSSTGVVYTKLKDDEYIKNLKLLAVSSMQYGFTYDSSNQKFVADSSNPTKLSDYPMIYGKSDGSTSSFEEVWNANNDGNLIFALIGSMPDGVAIKDFSHTIIDSLSITPLGKNIYSTDTNAYSSGSLPISALPFRAYESIYNALYRNTQNDPFIINGQEEYDKFVTNDDNGADSTDYHIFDAYWEKDCFTQSFQSPQQGNAPLLGLSGTKDAPSSLSPTYLLKYTSEDGSSHNLRVQNDNGSLKFSPLTTLTPELQGDLDALNSASQFGISINDLRNVNSLQHWLENALMNGYKYRDIIRAHFNIELSLKELEMPEFLGGKAEIGKEPEL